MSDPPVRCRECHRKLRDPAWAARRLGPICAKRLGLVAARPAGGVVVAPKPAAVKKAGDGEGQMVLFDFEEKGDA